MTTESVTTTATETDPLEKLDGDCNNAFVVRQDLSSDDCYDAATCKMQQVDELLRDLFQEAVVHEEIDYQTRLSTIVGLFNQARSAYRIAWDRSVREGIARRTAPIDSAAPAQRDAKERPTGDKAAVVEKGGVYLDPGDVAMVRSALLVGLTAYGDVRRKRVAADEAEALGEPWPRDHIPIDPGMHDEEPTSVFATALSIVSMADGDYT